MSVWVATGCHGLIRKSWVAASITTEQSYLCQSQVQTVLSHTCHPCIWSYPPKFRLYTDNQTKLTNRRKNSTVEDTLYAKDMGEARDTEELRSQFLQVLRSRRVGEVPLTVEHGKPVKYPLFQDKAPRSDEAMLSCPKDNIPNFEAVLKEENLYLTTENSIGRRARAIASADIKLKGRYSTSEACHCLSA